MSTRSLVVVEDESGKQVVCMYSHYDGYPSGIGSDLVAFLTKVKYGNGIDGEVPKGMMFANGMGCLAAWMVKEFKSDSGGIYLYPPKTRNCGEEYIYTITFNKDKGLCLKVETSNNNEIFSGPIKEWDLESIEKADK